ncbi:hypothetical protein ABZX95_06875 [Streptomyces sp. NPDC004232]|uniref:nucleotidyltransferase domain-containing protein n=1 Tax=Streptomyces sp. NPDC004232 TaxID=3154454 RepID=UPI0033A24EAF
MNRERAGRQLALIARTLATARRQGIPLWLRGGWAMDFLPGEVTREHGDSDWFAWARDAAPLAGRPAPDLRLDFVRGALDSSLALVDRDAEVGLRRAFTCSRSLSRHLAHPSTTSPDRTVRPDGTVRAERTGPPGPPRGGPGRRRGGGTRPVAEGCRPRADRRR